MNHESVMVTKSLQDFTRIINNYAHFRSSEFSISLASTVKTCDFDRQFLFAYLLRFAQNGTKNLSFNSSDLTLYDHAKITFIHPSN